MRGAAVATAALAVFLASAQVAHAAATARIDVFPSAPRVGQTVTVQFRAFWTMADGTLPPALFPGDLPWKVAAISPAGRPLGIPVTRAADNPYVWSGTIRFPSRGSWQVCVLTLSAASRSCVTDGLWGQRVAVRPRNAVGDVWQRLERPFHIPPLAPDSSCPTSSRDPKGDLSRIGSFTGVAWGQGPAYPGGLDSGQGKPVLRYLDPIPPESGFYGSNWFGNKVLWMVDPIYHGPMLIRGLQLDGRNEVRFDGGILPSRSIEVTLPPSPSARRTRPSYTRVRAAGCYAYQIDGAGFSSVLVFEARPFP